MKFRTRHYRGMEAIGMLAFTGVIVVQVWIRPELGTKNQSLSFLCGILPNFFAGIGISVSLFVRLFKSYPNKQFSLYTMALISCLLAIVGLSMWEVAQIVAGRRFDLYDIMATIAGAACTFMAFLVPISQHIYEL